MEHLQVRVSELKLGSVIAEDIFANTPYPIIRKDTKITREHFQVFQAFQITKVSITIVDPFNKPDEEIQKVSVLEKDQLTNSPSMIVVKRKFTSLYNQAVQDYKKEFLNWQSGSKVDITKVRNMIVPLVEYVLVDKQIVAKLNDFSQVHDYIYHHAIAIGIITGSLAQKLGYEKGQIIQIATAALLSDCGMSKIDTRLREKKAALTQHEFNEIKKHTLYGYQMIKDTPLLKPEMKLAIFQHHERLDGSGYPKGEKMESVTINSQIIAVADMYHAMTSERAYRSKVSPFKVMEMIREDEFGKFNIQVVQALFNIVGDLPIGMRVELSTGETGEVIFVQPNLPTRPMIRSSISGEILDLSLKRHLYIERILG
ncbi:MAG: HD-GYP domain-containing protein [Paenisporosarcina sp.]